MTHGSTSWMRRNFLKLAGKRAVVSSASDHIMVGTDYPFDLGDRTAAEKIQKMECTGAEREAMLHGNARKSLRIP